MPNKTSKNQNQDKATSSEKLWTPANLLSISRAPVGMVVIYIDYSFQTPWWLLFVLIIYAIASDMLDGLIARHRGEITEWGKILDPLADKITALLLFAYAVWMGRIPVEFFVFSILRDLTIVAGSVNIRKLHGRVPMSVMSGKISVNVMALYWIIAFFWPSYQQTVTVLMWLSIAIMLYSWIDYFVHYINIKKGAEFK